MIATLLDFKEILLEGTLASLYMTFLSTFFSYLIGLPLGICLHVTAKGGISENLPVNRVLGWTVNIGRSIPFIILAVTLSGLSRAIVGTSIGPTAAVVPLVIGAAPFVARLVEGSLAEVDGGVVEAALCMGATKWQIVRKVLLVEAVPSLVRGLSLTAITLIGYSAIAGAVGAGGLGDIAIRYGYYRKETLVMYITLILIVVIVAVIQGVLGLVAEKIDKKNK